MTLHKKLVTLTLCWTMLVIILGAYTRLTDAGLGCPDWPGCYGFLKVPAHPEKVLIAAERFPERPLETHKAWNEMVHRYLAGTLGLLIAALFISSVWQQRRLTIIPTALIILVCFQALLGALTVTMGLFPLVVMAHLLFGFGIFCLLALYWLKVHPHWLSREPQLLRLKPLAILAAIVVLMQIALGGWTAANYAALACLDLPLCETGWSNRLAFAEAFDLHLGHGDYEYGVMSQDARATIHVLHRIGALITFSVVAFYAWRLFKNAQSSLMQRLALAIGATLLLQFTLGVLNIVLHLPLANAVAHNFVGASLLMFVVVSVYQINQQQGRER
ncbi:heme A synthase [Alishewanella sp. SMS8]|uniref:COX15/CtaA family protein n=1 Tax=unclassified Alishewanella TaxID=2628974 RepID=UPI002742198E|nr:COX15/CtaA family protein [Alishewanella sp. SMS8]MDP4945622.1 COX15/CtaA family protein [Alishewanella sp.]MDP5460555.1 COX15/CtaA family protein [Alishewanella sp. SMS8]